MRKKVAKTSQATKTSASQVLSDHWNDKLPVDVVEIASKLGIQIKYGILEGNICGFLIYDDDTPIIGISSLHSLTRQRFTIAHEIGHYLQHPKESFIDNKYAIYWRNASASTGEKQQEVDANNFAAKLLMPKSAIQAELSKIKLEDEDESGIAKLADKFQVSTQAMTFRLINLGLASI